jgi:hypothetical protein
MSPELFHETLIMWATRDPFTPFVIELIGAKRLEIDHPVACSSRDGRAVAFTGPGGVMHVFDSDSVLRFIDAPAHTIRPRKPKK